MMYAVFSISNLCPDKRRCRLFPKKSDAERFLHGEWEDSLNTLIAEKNIMYGADARYNISSGLDEIDYEQTYHEYNYAVISDTKGSKIEWYVVEADDGTRKEAGG